MGTNLGSFDGSPLSGFVESPQKARNLRPVLVVLGQFSGADALTTDNVVIWDGAVFEDMDAGVTKSFLDPSEDARTARQWDRGIAVCGDFNFAGSLPVVTENVALYDRNADSWSKFLGGVTASTPTGLELCSGLEVFEGKLYACGIFDLAGGVSVTNVARWTGTAWENPGGVAGSLGFLKGFKDVLYLTGTVTTGPGIVRLVGSTWTALGSGLVIGGGDGTGSRMTTAVTDLDPTGAADSIRQLVVTGRYDTFNGVSASHIAFFDGSAVTALGSGITGTRTDCAAVLGRKLYVGGTFTAAGGVGAANIAAYDLDAGTWSALGSGLSASCFDVEAFDGELYATGSFTTAGGVGVGQIAKWNPTTLAWSKVGTTGLTSVGTPTGLGLETVFA